MGKRLVKVSPNSPLGKCFKAGGTVELFPLLAEWDKPTLKALIEQTKDFHCQIAMEIEERWKEQVFKSEIFLSAERSKQVDDIRKAQDLELVALCSEIVSVAMFYLRDET